MSYSQCIPITFPKISTTTNGGSFCLEGAGIPNGTIPLVPTTFYNNLCLSNNSGSFILSQENSSPNSYRKMLSLSNTNFSLIAPNPVGSTFDLTFDFNGGGGSAFIRAKRGGWVDTELQFRTNRSDNNGTINGIPPVRMVISSEGNVGINTPESGPNYRLDVYGIAKFCDETLLDSKLVIKGANATNYIPTGNIFNTTTKRDLAFEFAGAGSSIIRSFRGGYMNSYLQFLTNSKLSTTDSPQVRMQINEDGKVVIGNVTVPSASTTPYKLYVEGGVLTEKVKVAVKTSSLWSDYVFFPDYKLKPLHELEKYIIENKHLPNIPSSDELVKEGLDLAEMQAKQMAKIEELTLYMIEIKKEVEELKKENTQLKKKISIFKN